MKHCNKCKSEDIDVIEEICSEPNHVLVQYKYECLKCGHIAWVRANLNKPILDQKKASELPKTLT